jgi:hypothetical protein
MMSFPDPSETQFLNGHPARNQCSVRNLRRESLGTVNPDRSFLHMLRWVGLLAGVCAAKKGIDRGAFRGRGNLTKLSRNAEGMTTAQAWSTLCAATWHNTLSPDYKNFTNDADENVGYSMKEGVWCERWYGRMTVYVEEQDWGPYQGESNATGWHYTCRKGLDSASFHVVSSRDPPSYRHPSPTQARLGLAGWSHGRGAGRRSEKRSGGRRLQSCLQSCLSLPTA